MTPSFVERLGSALSAPRRAFAVADEARGGSADGMALLALAFVCVETRSLAAAAWGAWKLGPAHVLPALLARFQAALGTIVVLWLCAWLVITIGAGRKRSPSRDFDLAQVAWVPYLFVQMLERNFGFFHRRSLGLTMIDSRWNRQIAPDQLNSAAKSR